MTSCIKQSIVGGQVSVGFTTAMDTTWGTKLQLALWIVGKGRAAQSG